MAFGSEKAIGLTLALAAAAMGEPLQYRARHDHWRKGCAGTFTVDQKGVSFQGPRHRFQWDYQEIQQLALSAGRLTVVTYRDNLWKLGADREHRFEFDAGQSVEDAYRLLAGRLDQRFVAALVGEAVEPLWELPVKLLGRIKGSEGVLSVGRDWIVYRTEQPGASRTWRYMDVESISSSGPFQLTLTTYERARLHYGNRKGFSFQLKQPLAEDRYNDLWRRLNQKGRGR